MEGNSHTPYFETLTIQVYIKQNVNIVQLYYTQHRMSQSKQ